MKYKSIIWCAVMLCSMGCAAQKNVATNTSLQPLIGQNFKDGAAQYKVMMKKLPAGRFPKTYEKDTLRTSGSDWWCSGFYPGSLLYLYEQTKDTVLYNEATRMLGLLTQEQFNTHTHDLGFMMYCSFGNALRLHPDNEA